VKAFKREMRFARRVYRRDLRSNFDEEIREGQEGKEEELYSSVEEDEVEAWENYEFDGMMQFDIDLANQLVDFCQYLILHACILSILSTCMYA
jgi:hypothetical protein